MSFSKSTHDGKEEVGKSLLSFQFLFSSVYLHSSSQSGNTMSGGNPKYFAS